MLNALFFSKSCHSLGFFFVKLSTDVAACVWKQGTGGRFFCCEESPSLLRRTRKSFTKTWAIWRPQVLREVFFQTNHLLFGSWQVKVYGNPENPQLITKLHIKMVYSGPQLNLPLKWFWKKYIYINMSFWCSDFLRVESFQRTGPSLTRLTVVVRVTGVESPSR